LASAPVSASEFYKLFKNIFIHFLMLNGRSNMSFAARLQKAIDVLTALLSFTGFNPPPDYSLEKFKELITAVAKANSDVQAKVQAYRQAVVTRAGIFKQYADEVILRPIKLRGAVIAAYGRNSHQDNMITDLLRRLRLTRIIITPPDPNTDAAEKKVIISDRGYGAMLGHLHDIVDAMKTFPDWDLKMPDMTIAVLEKALDDARAANLSVMETFLARSAARKMRNDLYLKLRDFVDRMKGYVKSKYGPGHEDDLIRSVKI
jgi:hypothetical protein